MRQYYISTQRIDPWPGSSVDHPYYEGTSVRAGAEWFRSQGLLDSYYWEFEDIDVVKRHLLNVGPVVAGTRWDYNMMLHDIHQDYKGTPILQLGGGMVGGHAYLIFEYDKRRKGAEFTILNSWGTMWGKNGEAYISETDLVSLLQDDGEIMTAIETR
jgi:hypothetical protein